MLPTTFSSHVAIERGPVQLLGDAHSLPLLPLPLSLRSPSPFPFPPSPLPSGPLPLPSLVLRSPFLPLEVGPLNPARGLGERYKLPSRNRINLVHFSFNCNI